MKGILDKVSPFLLHLLIVASVFDIYFKSPIVHVPDPEMPEFECPARRVVLFVADGLRAQSFYKPNVAPFLHQTGLRQGVLGISHTRVPTESRPGHVALLAGLYEDPSAITRGWTENPVEFDSVFNRSTNGWAWGSPDILPMFAKGSAGSKLDIFTYDASLEDFGQKDSSYLDTWVFDKVDDFFSSALEDSGLQLRLRSQGNIFFLHLLGCDTNGHTNKPNSAEYMGNIAVVDNGIQRIVQTIERYYRDDRRTAYIFTADHGMTDWGSHGTGMDEETMTPFLAWGAGIKHLHPDHNSINLADFLGNDFADFVKKPDKVDIQQADVAPLISSLIGRNIPVNSVGLLPHQILDMHPLDVAKAMKAQYKQLLAQYLKLRQLHEENYLPFIYHKECPSFSRTEVDSCESSIDRYISNKLYNQSISAASACIGKAMAGVNYYARYQQTILKLLISFTLLCSMLTNAATARRHMYFGPRLETGGGGPSLIDGVLLSLLLVSWACQRLPAHFVLYYAAPVYALSRLRTAAAAARTGGPVSPVYICICLVICEAVVAAFFDRRFLTLGVLVLSLTAFRRHIVSGVPYTGVHLCLLPVLAVFSWLPPIDGRRQYTELVLLSAVLYCAAIHFIIKGNFLLRNVLMFSNLIAAFCVHFSSIYGLNLVVQGLSWTIFLLSPPAVLLLATDVKTRVLGLMFALGACYSLLSLSYESLFLLSLCLALVAVNQGESRSKTSTIEFVGNRSSVVDNSQDITCILSFFFLVFYSFFGTGNIASLNSFDPGSIRCFVSVFNPFLMGGLLLVKILIPILTTGILFSYTIQLRGMDLRLVMSVLQLFTDLLSLQFFHLVKDTGSWLEIGSSLSHFIIVEGTSVFLLLLLQASTFLISVGLPKKMSFD